MPTPQFKRSWFSVAPKRWIAISRLEQVELGIPSGSIKGRPVDFAIDYLLVDRRCLARYRRRWRSLPEVDLIYEQSFIYNSSNLEEKYGSILDDVLELMRKESRTE